VIEPAARDAAPVVELRSLDTLWFQVGGTICNLACTHCFVSCSPTNHTHEFLGLGEVRRYLDEAAALGVREYYFTGGEPFLNPEMEAILAATLAVGPANVLTNGLLLDPPRCDRLRRLDEASDYSLDLRVSMDGYEAAANDPIRGEGHDDNGSVRGKERFFQLLGELGIAKPRLKILPVFQIGAEVERGGAYESWQRLRSGDAPEDGWDHLQCSACRMVTDQGVWVCPILVNEPGGKMGETLADTLDPFTLDHPACWTCHVYGVSCKT
jgi:hypothetical protein